MNTTGKLHNIIKKKEGTMNETEGDQRKKDTENENKKEMELDRSIKRLGVCGVLNRTNVILFFETLLSDTSH